jgi:2-polyprenyl-3-methyl-5-hydroxy-6-metoxy-1,4-benzoquinol methylase
MECNTIQLSEDFEEAYEDDYQRNTSFSKSALAFIEENINNYEALQKGLEKKNIVEIGCGDGLFSELLLKRGAVITGFEPSKAASLLAEKRGVKVINNYFDKKTATFPEKFDGFVIRFVLEHIPKPNEFLNLINENCKEGAIGLIEVPSFEKMLKEKRYFEFFREHVIYFSGNTLTHVLNRNGFELLKYYTVMNDDYLVAIVKKVTLNKKLKEFNESQDKINTHLNKMINEITLKNKRIAFWGASGGGVSLINYANINSENVKCIFDSDPNKWERYTFGKTIKIVEPTEEKISSIDAIIILSMTYENEITLRLKNEFHFKGMIGSLVGVPHWIE